MNQYFSLRLRSLREQCGLDSGKVGGGAPPSSIPTSGYASASGSAGSVRTAVNTNTYRIASSSSRQQVQQHHFQQQQQQQFQSSSEEMFQQPDQPMMDAAEVANMEDIRKRLERIKHSAN